MSGLAPFAICHLPFVCVCVCVCVSVCVSVCVCATCSMYIYIHHESSEGSSSTTNPKPIGETIPVSTLAHAPIYNPAKGRAAKVPSLEN